MTEQTNHTKGNKLKSWLKKVGWAGFLFFLIKGLIWLGVFAYAWWKMQ